MLNNDSLKKGSPTHLKSLKFFWVLCTSSVYGDYSIILRDTLQEGPFFFLRLNKQTYSKWSFFFYYSTDKSLRSASGLADGNTKILLQNEYHKWEIFQYDTASKNRMTTISLLKIELDWVHGNYSWLRHHPALLPLEEHLPPHHNCMQTFSTFLQAAAAFVLSFQ